jgi:hypothetical protein
MILSILPRRGRPPIPDDPIDPAQPRRGRGRPSLPDDPTQPRRGRGHPSFPMIPSIPPSLGVDVRVYLMRRHRHRHRIELPQVTLCPRHTGLGSKASGRLYTMRQRNIALNAMKDGLTYS